MPGAQLWLALRQRQRTATVVLDAIVWQPRKDAPCLRAKAARHGINGIRLTQQERRPAEAEHLRDCERTGAARDGVPFSVRQRVAHPLERMPVSGAGGLRPWLRLGGYAVPGPTA